MARISGNGGGKPKSGKGVGGAISRGGKKLPKQAFGAPKRQGAWAPKSAPKVRVRPKQGNAGVGGKVKVRAKVKKDSRTAADSNPTPKLKRQGVSNAGLALSPLGKKTVAPVLTALDLSTRPLHTIAGAERQALKGGLNAQNLPKIGEEAKKGATGKTRYGTADLLKLAGVKNKVLLGVAGQVGDVVGDPTTYVTLGGGSLAAHAVGEGAEAAAKGATKKALKAGLSDAKPTRLADEAVARARERAARRGKSLSQEHESQIRRSAETRSGPAPISNLADAARNQAGKKAKPGFEMHVNVGGKRVARVKVKHAPVREGGLPVDAPDSVRRAVQHVRPTVRSSGATSPLEKRAVLSTRSEQRAIQNDALSSAQRNADDIAARIPREQHARVVDAIERNKIGSLPENLRDPAVRLRASFRHHSRLRRQAGIKQGTIRDYFPHMRESTIKRGEASTEAEALQREAQRAGSATGSVKRRDIREPVSDANKKVKPGHEFSTDIPVVHANYEVQTGRLLAGAHGARSAREIGRPAKVVLRKAERNGKTVYRRAVELPEVGKNDVVVHVGKKVRVLTGDEVDALRRGEAISGLTGGQFRVMAAESARDLAAPVSQASGVLARRVVHPWKTVATATPAFHVRNAIGDAERAFSAGIKARDMPRLFKDAGQAIRYQHQNAVTLGRGAAAGTARRVLKDKTVVDLGKSGKVTMREFSDELKRNGIVRAGQRGGELQHIGGDTFTMGKEATGRFAKTRGNLKAVHRAVSSEAGHPLSRANQVLVDRENITYVATYKHFREKGLSERESARKTMDALIDYGEVTPFEQKLRNTAVPFYTFQSRVVPFYAKTMVQRPGKIATYAKLRENTGRVFGQDPNDLQKESDYKQRQASLPIAGKFVSAGLPLVQGVNEAFAIPAQGVKGGTQELARYAVGSLAPWVKAPAELGPLALAKPGTQGGYNYFFESPVESQHHRLVTAPMIPGLPWDKIPEGTRKKLGVVQIVDRRTGRKVWGWRGWKSYISQNALPGAPGFALRVGQSINQRGQNQGQQIAGFLTGVKIDNPDPIGAAIDRAYAQLDLTTALKSDLGQQPGGKTSKQYAKLKAQERKLKVTIFQLSRKRGDKTPLQQNAPKSTRKGGASNEFMPGGGGGTAAPAAHNEFMP